MKIEAYIDIIEAGTDNVLDTATIPVDMDYVEDDADSVNQWIENSDDWYWIANNWKQGGKLVTFDVTNMSDVLEDLKFDEFQRKVN